MNDIYQRLDNIPSRKVSPRTNDGFTDSSSPESSDSPPPLNPPSDSSPDFLIETSKSKLLTLEVNLRQTLDRLLYENPDVSWDTLLEAALILSLKSSTSQDRLLKLAAERLANRKKSAVYKRSVTMAQKYT
ncbi:MAG: hypothetical protein AAFO95_20840 [Cyanobacteria bacterium J06600_6]